MKFKLAALTLALLPALSYAAVSDKVLQPSYDADSVIVIYKEKASGAQKRQARLSVGAKISDLNADEIDDSYNRILNGRLAKLELKNISVKDAIEKLKMDPAVKYAEPNYRVNALTTPNDPRFDELWGLNNTGQNGGVADADIDAVEAWDVSIGSRNVVVGVIDTGVDYTHPDLVDNIWVNPNEVPNNGIDDDNNGYIDDVHGINAMDNTGDPMDTGGHGTHVSGTIGASGNNGVGVVGINHEVSIVGCKFLGEEGGTTADAIKCINYFIDLKQNGVDIRMSNNSWGGGGFSEGLSHAITASEDAGMLFIAAAGNDGYDNDATTSYPSGYSHDSIIAVASTTRNDTMSSFSQWGLTSVDLGAPGSAIVSTTPNNSYASFNGTSMATPHVTGAAALVLSVNPELTAAELKALLMTSGDNNDALTGKTVSGKRLNVFNAVQDADPTPTFRLLSQQKSATISAGDSVSYNFEVGNVADWSGQVMLSLSDAPEGMTAQLSDSEVVPGDTFTVTVVTTAETAWGDFNFTLSARSGDLEKEAMLSLKVLPQGLKDVSYSNNQSIDIPDNNEAGITSTINVPDELTIFNTTTSINIAHTWIGDLVITLTSPAGSSATLHNKAGGNGTSIDASFPASAFDGEIAKGEWKLHVVDTADADSGTLNNWSIEFSATGELEPIAPVANFSSEIDFLTAMFTDLSTDNNNDIISWNWNFGDEKTSVDQNPSHTFVEAGSYDVSLTTTDSQGLSNTTTQSITVSDVNIEAQVRRAYKSRFGRLSVDLKWNGSTAETVDIYRNGVKYKTVSNSGRFRDRERRATESTFVYKICETSTVCSNELTVSF
jgi:serine protease